MTTIVWRGGILATDLQATLGGDTISMTGLRKIHRLKSGGLVAGCGVTAKIHVAVKAIEDGAKMPSLNDATLIEVHPHGEITVHEAGGSYTVCAKSFYAWGSGMSPALGALHVGASAVEAVAAATKVDPYSGGAVQSARLKPARKPTTRKAR